MIAQKYVQRSLFVIHGFTLIELLITIAIIGVLSAAIIVGINPLKKVQDARNATRKADLSQIASALTVYATMHNGQYPSTGGSVCGLASDFSACGTDWVPGLVADGDLKVLPRDPKTGQSVAWWCGTNVSSYAYRSDGTDYKLFAYCTIEGYDSTHTVPSSDPFYDPAHTFYAFQISTPGGAAW